jgi:hypothetical protein
MSGRKEKRGEGRERWRGRRGARERVKEWREGEGIGGDRI